jgi:hypothetical protein
VICSGFGGIANILGGLTEKSLYQIDHLMFSNF